jgi:DNA replication protein DnaD
MKKNWKNMNAKTIANIAEKRCQAKESQAATKEEQQQK